MARYVLIRIDDDQEADDFLRDVTVHPHAAVRTPGHGSAVHVEVVADMDPSDRTEGHKHLMPVVRRSYLRAGELAMEWEVAS